MKKDFQYKPQVPEYWRTTPRHVENKLGLFFGSHSFDDDRVRRILDTDWMAMTIADTISQIYMTGENAAVFIETKPDESFRDISPPNTDS